MKQYSVCISSNSCYCPVGEIGIQCANKTEARAAGRLYIKQWQLSGAKIEYIRELKEGDNTIPNGRYKQASDQAVFTV